MSAENLQAVLNSVWYLDEDFPSTLDICDGDGMPIACLDQLVPIVGAGAPEFTDEEIQSLALHICQVHNDARPARGTPADMLQQARHAEAQIAQLVNDKESWYDNSPRATPENKLDTSADREWLAQIRANIARLETLAAGAAE